MFQLYSFLSSFRLQQKEAHVFFYCKCVSTTSKMNSCLCEEGMHEAGPKLLVLVRAVRALMQICRLLVLVVVPREFDLDEDDLAVSILCGFQSIFFLACLDLQSTNLF